jgi:FixJ family two-component response regulator
MIYIVDDDPHVRDAFLMLINSAGYKCKVFNNAEKFLNAYEKATNDLLILDMHLIEINGCTLLEKLENKGFHLPVIVITGFDEPKYRECCKKYGVLAFLRKPVDGEALLDIIKYNFSTKVLS